MSCEEVSTNVRKSRMSAASTNVYWTAWEAHNTCITFGNLYMPRLQRIRHTTTTWSLNQRAVICIFISFRVVADKNMLCLIGSYYQFKYFAQAWLGDWHCWVVGLIVHRFLTKKTRNHLKLIWDCDWDGLGVLWRKKTFKSVFKIYQSFMTKTNR